MVRMYGAARPGAVRLVVVAAFATVLAGGRAGAVYHETLPDVPIT